MKTCIMRLSILAAAIVATSALAADPPPPLVIQGIVKAPVSDVWKVFGTAEGFKKLGCAHCDLDLRVGGVIRTHYDPKGVLGDEGTIHNEILAYEPEHMLTIRIKQPPKGFPFQEASWKSAWTVITLTDLGDGRTHVRMTAMGYPSTEDGQKMRKFFESGNDYVLKVLQKSFDASAVKPTGSAHAANPLAPISIERIVELPREEAWHRWATSDGWKKSLGLDSKIELRPGGPFELYFSSVPPQGQRGSEDCKVLSFVPQQMLSFTWNAPPKFEHARGQRTWVVVHFDEISPTKTRIRLDHLGFAENAAQFPDHRAEWEQVRAYFQPAWTMVLSKFPESK